MSGVRRIYVRGVPGGRTEPRATFGEEAPVVHPKSTKTIVGAQRYSRDSTGKRRAHPVDMGNVTTEVLRAGSPRTVQNKTLSGAEGRGPRQDVYSAFSEDVGMHMLIFKHLRTCA